MNCGESRNPALENHHRTFVGFFKVSMGHPPSILEPPSFHVVSVVNPDTNRQHGEPLRRKPNSDYEVSIGRLA
jgi:hypothetical protein